MGIGLGVVMLLTGLALAPGPVGLPGGLDPQRVGWALTILGAAGILVAYAAQARRHALQAAQATTTPREDTP